MTADGTGTAADRAAGRRSVSTVLGLCVAGGATALFAAGRPWLRLAVSRSAPLPDVSLPVTGGTLEPLVPALAMVGLAGAVAVLATGRRGRLLVGLLLAVAGSVVATCAGLALRAPGQDRTVTMLTDAARAGGLGPHPVVRTTVVAGWPVLAALGGLAILAGGLDTVRRGRTWPTMSSRYERAAPADGPADAPAASSASTPTSPSTGRVPGAPAAPPAGAAGPPAVAGDTDARHAAQLWDQLDRGSDPTR